jgi:hypothetical protein
MVLALLLSACSDDKPAAGEESGPPPDTDTAPDTDTDTAPPHDTAQTLALGDPCDPETSDCGPDAACCSACCWGEETPECTAVDEYGGCPLPDLSVDARRLERSLDLQNILFKDDDCALTEACVDAPGWRKVLRFDTTTPNTGTAAVTLGRPSDNNDLFAYSECHDHYHFVAYADYRLLTVDGALAAEGHKQAFCLMDFERWTDEASAEPRYSCDLQGLSVGWADTYDSTLDCQWVDVTDVPPGDYLLEVTVNPDELLPELSFDNNTSVVPVTIPGETPPVTDPCASESYGEARECGWESRGDFACVPGEDVEIGCVGTCEGTCEDDTVLRVCAGSGNACEAPDALAANDNAACGSACSVATFTCPTEGVVTVLVGAWDAAAPDTCDVDWQ